MNADLILVMEALDGFTDLIEKGSSTGKITIFANEAVLFLSEIELQLGHLDHPRPMGRRSAFGRSIKAVGRDKTKRCPRSQ